MSRALTAYDLPSVLLLLDVERTGSLTRAADEWQMTASAVSQRIAKLERACGQQLIARLSRGVRLTEAGRALCAHASSIDNELRRAQGALASLRTLETGRVRLGSFPTASATVVSDVYQHVRSRHPELTIDVHSALRGELLDMLESGDLDLVALWSYQDGADAPDDVAVELLGHDPTMLLAPASTAYRAPVRLDDLADESWLVRTAEHPATLVLQESCERAGFTPRIVYAARDYAEMQAMVAAGLGVAMVPRLALQHHRPDVTAHPFVDASQIPVRTILLGSHRRRSDSPAMAALRRAFHERAAALLDPIGA